MTESIANDEDTDVNMNAGRSWPIRNVFTKIFFINITGFKNSDTSADANLISDTEANNATEMEGGY